MSKKNTLEFALGQSPDEDGLMININGGSFIANRYGVTVWVPAKELRRFAASLESEIARLAMPDTAVIPVAAVERLAHQQAAERADPVAAEVQAAIRVTGEDAQLCGKCGQVFCECPAAVEFVDAMEFAGPTS